MISRRKWILAALVIATAAAQNKEKPFKTPAEADTQFHLPPPAAKPTPIAAKPKPAAAPAKPDGTKCFKVDSMTAHQEEYGPPEYEVIAHSECIFEVKDMWVIVKHFDNDGYRIGFDAWGVSRLPHGEKIKHRFEAHISRGTKLFRIEVVEITPSWDVASPFTHLRDPSTSLVIDNFSGNVRNFEKK